MICPKCNQQVEENSKFCGFCGEKLEAPAPAPAPAAEPVTESAPSFAAESAPAPMAEPAAESAPAPAEEAAPVSSPVADVASQVAGKVNELKKKVSPKVLIAGGIGVAVIAVVLVLALILPSMGSAVNYAMYVKDGELMKTNLPKAKPWTVTDEIFQNDVDDEDVADYKWSLGNVITVTKDGDKIFYAEDFEINSNSYTDVFTLYCRDAGSEKKEPVKIASDVTEYSVSSDGKLVTYLTDDGDLYQHNLKEKTKIESDVKYYYTANDEKSILYMDDENDLYLKSGNKEAERIGKEISDCEFANEDLSKIYFTKDDNLYLKDGKKEAKKILSDVYSVIGIYESGEIYYTVASETEAKLWDYVKDDCKSDADAEAPVEPDYPEYPDSPDYDDYDDYDAYRKAYNEYWDERERLYDEYQEAYNEYREAMYDYEDIADRNELREELKDYTVSSSKYALHYYDGKKDTVITENYGGWEARSYEEAIFVYTVEDESNIGKINLSEIDGTWDVESFINSNSSSDGAVYVATKANAKELKVEDKAYGFTLSEDGKALYYADDVNTEKNECTVYKVEISEKKLSKPEAYDDEVYCYEGSFGSVYTRFYVVGNDVVCFKDVKDGEGDLYINKENVDSDVYLSIPDECDGTFYYFIDWDDDDDCGTLRKYSGKKAETVYEDVCDYVITPDGDVLLMADYSKKRYTGDLYVYTGKKAVKVDEDVSCIISYTYAGEE